MKRIVFVTILLFLFLSGCIDSQGNVIPQPTITVTGNITGATGATGASGSNGIGVDNTTSTWLNKTFDNVILTGNATGNASGYYNNFGHIGLATSAKSYANFFTDELYNFISGDNSERFGIVSQITAGVNYLIHGNYSGVVSGLLARVNIDSSNTANWTSTPEGVIGLEASVRHLAGSSGNVTGAMGIWSRYENFSTNGRLLNWYGAYFDEPLYYYGAPKVLNLAQIYMRGIANTFIDTGYQIYQVDGENYFGGSLNVSGYINTPVMKPSTPSTNSFRFTKTDGTTELFTIDTTNGVVKIAGKSSSNAIPALTINANQGNTVGQLLLTSTTGGASNQNAYVSFYDGDNSLKIATGYTGGSTRISLSPAGTESLSVINGGNVGIGTTSPESLLDVRGTSNFTGLMTVNADILLKSGNRIAWSDNSSIPSNIITPVAWLPVKLPDGTTAYIPAYK